MRNSVIQTMSRLSCRPCGLCGGSGRVQVHHLDWDHSNNAATNRVEVCQRCHSVLHQVGVLSGTDLLRVRELVGARLEAAVQADLFSGSLALLTDKPDLVR